MQTENRKTELDILRVLAGLMVVFNHVAGQDMRLFSGASGAIALFALYLSKSAIPLFLIITGATLLKREEPYVKTLRRIGRMVLVLGIVTLFYYGVSCIEERTPFVPGEYFDALYYVQAITSLWYLYAYVGLLAMLPILQRMTAAFGENEYRYFAFWTLVFVGGMPILEHITPLFTTDSSFTLPVFTGMIGMAVLGSGLDTHMRFSPWRTALAIALPLVMTAAMTVATLQKQVLFGLFDNAFLLPQMITALCLLYLARMSLEKLRSSARIGRWLAHASRLVFCAYLITDFLIARLQFVREALVPVLRTNGAGAVYTLIVYAVALLLAEGLTRIPGLKQLL